MKLFHMCCSWLLDFNVLVLAWEKKYHGKVKLSEYCKWLGLWVTQVKASSGAKPVVQCGWLFT